ncbi:MAG: hypothetical protein AAFS10_20645 [Myxococcota bacterium]
MLRHHVACTLVFIVSALMMIASGCNFTEDLDTVRDDALERQDPRLTASELCVSYCDLAQTACITDDTRLFADDSECFTTCAAYPTTGFTSDTITDRWGDSVQCRIAHLETATIDPVTHCPHGSPEGGGKCVGSSPCAIYCGLMEENCVGASSPFDPENLQSQCFEACLVYPVTNSSADTTGDSYECRLNAVLQAPNDPATFCASAAPDGGTVCVGDTEATENAGGSTVDSTDDN